MAAEKKKKVPLVGRNVHPRGLVEAREVEAFREGKGNCTMATPLDCKMRPERAKQMLAVGWLGSAPFHSKAEASRRYSLLGGTEPLRRDKEK